MKKSSYLILGLVLGAGLSFSFSAAADEIQNMIGKRVESQAEVQVNGVGLSANAIIIEGTSYAPVRAIGEAVGLTVDWKEEKVVLNKKTTSELQAETKKLIEESEKFKLDAEKFKAEADKFQAGVEKRKELQKQLDAIGLEVAPIAEAMHKFETTPEKLQTITIEEYKELKKKYDEYVLKAQEIEAQIQATYVTESSK